jgi:CheY-like chemotaxis protein
MSLGIEPTTAGEEVAVARRPRRRPGPRRGPDDRAPHTREATLVLLVDDVADQRELYSQYLRFLGHSVATARDGREAVAQAARLEPDVVVMDLSMPVMDGFEATRALKAHPDTREIPVVALPGYASYLPEEWARSAGCAAYVSKPCLPASLSEVIRRVLRRPGPRQ